MEGAVMVEYLALPDEPESAEPELLSGVELVSWDLDATLYDLRALERVIRRRCLWSCVGLNFSWVAGWRAFSKARLGLERARNEGLNERTAEMIRTKMERFDETLLLPALRPIGPRPKALRWLRYLRRRGLQQVVISDLRASRKLEVLGVGDLFSAVYEGVELGSLKPDPQLFRRAQMDFAIGPEAHLHIGDRPECDSIGAEAAGARVRMIE